MGALPVWMGSVPDYEVVGGNMHITIGDFCIACPVNVFLMGCAKGRQAIIKWQSRRPDAEVIDFPKHA